MSFRYNPFTGNFDIIKKHYRADEKVYFNYPDKTVYQVWSSADQELQVFINNKKRSGVKE